MTEARLNEVREIVAQVLAEVFGGTVRFGRIYMGSTVDHDGFEYVTAHVIYESPDASLTGVKMLDVHEPLNDRVRELGVDAIPVVSYIAKSEEREWLGDSPESD
ncbi:MAG: hypothetical protein OXE58_13530 [Acidobacteria bacterium]|nr:hypothetical protein [Acidobacteriota bacterium]